MCSQVVVEVFGMPVPEGVWQWPLLAGLLVVVGWVLWTQREALQRAAVERERHEAQIGKMLEEAEEERRRQLEAWEGLVRESVAQQVELTKALGALCGEVRDLGKAMSEEHGAIMARCSVEHGKAAARGGLVEALEVRGGKG